MELELGRRVHRWASTRRAGRRGASRVGLGFRICNAFRSTLRTGGGRSRKAVYSGKETEIDMPYDLVQFSGVALSSPRGSLQSGPDRIVKSMSSPVTLTLANQFAQNLQ